MIVVEGDRVYFEDHLGVIYRVTQLIDDWERGNLVVEETDEPDLFPKGMERENVDLTGAMFVGGAFVEEPV